MNISRQFWESLSFQNIFSDLCAVRREICSWLRTVPFSHVVINVWPSAFNDNLQRVLYRGEVKPRFIYRCFHTSGMNCLDGRLCPIFAGLPQMIRHSIEFTFSHLASHQMVIKINAVCSINYDSRRFAGSNQIFNQNCKQNFSRRDKTLLV